MIGPHLSHRVIEEWKAAWWQRRSLLKDPAEMTPAERDDAQIVLLDQWLRANAIRRAARSSRQLMTQAMGAKDVAKGIT